MKLKLNYGNYYEIFKDIANRNEMADHEVEDLFSECFRGYCIELVDERDNLIDTKDYSNEYKD